MMTEKLKIVFMGTPEFAVGILDTICNSDYEIVGVITAPDKPAGRGQKIKFSAVKEYSLKHNLKILQPTNLKSEDFLHELKLLNANLQVVVAFRMLPKLVWEMPQFGTFNLHASLLPNYRGAAPINWAIINGESKTGVTTFFIDDKIDTGAMILRKEIPISSNENAGALQNKLMVLGSEVVISTLDLIANNKVKLAIQEENFETKTAHKLNKENCKINWNESAVVIQNLIRGLSPNPASWCFFKDNENEWNVKIYDTSIMHETHQFENGKILASKKELKIATSDGFLKIESLQFPGKKKMTASEVLNGLAFTDAAIAF
jgi:methionyl-tRNA formyltransferase